MSFHRELHRRLMNPPNAVPDPGFGVRVLPANVVPFRPRDITRREVSELRRLEDLTAEFWHPYHVDLLEAPPVPSVRRPTVPSIIRATASTFGVSVGELVSNMRTKPLVTYRHVAIAIACRLSGRSLPFIGRHFNRDHTSILHARNKMQPLMDAAARDYDGASPWAWAMAMRRRLECS